MTRQQATDLCIAFSGTWLMIAGAMPRSPWPHTCYVVGGLIATGALFNLRRRIGR